MSRDIAAKPARGHALKPMAPYPEERKRSIQLVFRVTPDVERRLFRHIDGHPIRGKRKRQRARWIARVVEEALAREEALDAMPAACACGWAGTRGQCPEASTAPGRHRCPTCRKLIEE